MDVDTGLLLIRLVVGLLFIGHGTQKLFGWWRGEGVAGTGAYFESLGYENGPRMAVLAGAAETFGGVSLVLGFLTPVGAAAITGVMVSAILSAHWNAGLWTQHGGYEYPVVLAVTAIALTLMGPGAISLDTALGWELAGPVWATVALLVGAAASFTAIGTKYATTEEHVVEEREEVGSR